MVLKIKGYINIKVRKYLSLDKQRRINYGTETNST